MKLMPRVQFPLAPGKLFDKAKKFFTNNNLLKNSMNASGAKGN